MIIDSRLVPDPLGGPLSYRITIHQDEHATTGDADCYTPKQIEAWKNDEWQYVGVVVTPVIAHLDISLGMFEESLWGVEYGSYVLTDEDDSITPDSPRYIGTDELTSKYPGPDLIDEARRAVAEALPAIVAELQAIALPADKS